jgi:NAD(P)-dependent dehydrogenase (short-subunit alcohol dehydrogenase family)
MPSVLVTGAGRGIGRTTALRLAAAGWDVYAGVRKLEDAPDGTTGVQLDITTAEQVGALETALPERLDAVVNNAGIVVGAPVETVGLDDLRMQLEVNVTGQVAVTQAVLPRLRASRGRIVFVSSVSGRVATPMTGPYNASKFALEGLADSLRMELAPWGIRVVLVEPAQTATDMWGTADDLLRETVDGMSPEHRALYAKHTEGMKRVIKMSLKMAVPPENVAAAIEKALTASRPRARYVVGAAPKVQAALAKVTPTPVMDAVLRTATGVPKRP